jgi:hypothetical protein
MEFFYKVEMSNQWRPGFGGIVDLNCGWYCQDALLTWYCTKNKLQKIRCKNAMQYSRMSFGFNPEDSLCLEINIPKNINEYKVQLLKNGPIIASGKLGMANFGFFGGVGHYVLIVGVKTKTNDIIIYDPLSIDFSKINKSKLSIYKFSSFVQNVEECLVINKYALSKLF